MFSAGYKFVEIERIDCESFQDYLERCYFVINNLKSGEYDYEFLIEKSKLYRLVKILKCRYDEKTMDEIRKMAIYSSVSL